LFFVLSRTRSGVVAGRIQTTGSNAHIDCRCFFVDIDSFEACCRLDETRFKYPMAYAKLQEAFNDAIAQPAWEDDNRCIVENAPIPDDDHVAGRTDPPR
jgi:hypothetical protein